MVLASKLRRVFWFMSNENSVILYAVRVSFPWSTGGTDCFAGISYPRVDRWPTWKTRKARVHFYWRLQTLLCSYAPTPTSAYIQDHDLSSASGAAGDASDTRAHSFVLLLSLLHSFFLPFFLSSMHAQTHTKSQQHLSAARVLTESKQQCLYQPMCISATGTPFIPIISDYHHWVLLLLLIRICTSRATDLYQRCSCRRWGDEHSYFHYFSEIENLPRIRLKAEDICRTFLHLVRLVSGLFHS